MREVVLGEQVDEQGAADGFVHGRLRLVPHLTGLEVLTETPRHELVGEPLLRVLEVALQERLGDGVQLLKEGDVSVHSHEPILPRQPWAHPTDQSVARKRHAGPQAGNGPA